MTFAPFRSSSLILAAVALMGVLAASQAHAHDHGPQAAKAQATAARAAAPDAHTRADIERHRAMAKAHEAAAQCLANGGEHEKCEKQLQTDCKGLALGKFCGMRHAH